jgi:hypothetical protein
VSIEGGRRSALRFKHNFLGGRNWSLLTEGKVKGNDCMFEEFGLIFRKAP